MIPDRLQYFLNDFWNFEHFVKIWTQRHRIIIKLCALLSLPGNPMCFTDPTRGIMYALLSLPGERFVLY